MSSLMVQDASLTTSEATAHFRGLAEEARLSILFQSLVPRSITTRRDSPAVLPLVVLLCPARYSPLRSVPSLPQRLSAFRSCLPPAYRLCYASQSSAESPEPSSKEFLRHSLLPVSVALTASACFASTTEFTLRRRPDSPVRRSLRPTSIRLSYMWRSHRTTSLQLFPSATCRGLRPCPLVTFASCEDAAIAATSHQSKVTRPT